MDVIDGLAYKVAGYQYPNHYSYSKDEIMSILLDVGLKKDIIDIILNNYY